MRFDDIEWSEAVAEKLWSKHGVDTSEVIEALDGETFIRRGSRGLYYVLGRTEAGRYLFVAVRSLGDGMVRLVTARDMDASERRTYQRR